MLSSDEGLADFLSSRKERREIAIAFTNDKAAAGTLDWVWIVGDELHNITSVNWRATLVAAAIWIYVSFLPYKPIKDVSTHSLQGTILVGKGLRGLLR